MSKVIVCFKIPQRLTRSTTLIIYVSNATTNYLMNEPLKMLMTNANVDPSFPSLYGYTRITA